MKYRLRSILLGLALLLPLSASAQVRFDTVSTKPVGPGMVYTRIVAPSVPWSIDVLELEVKNPYLKLETVSANDRLGGGRELTSSMAARRHAPGHEVVGAINGDFFSGNGTPNHMQVAQGEIVRGENPNYPAVGFDRANRPVIVRAHVGGVVKVRQDSVALAGVNKARGTDQLVLYNPFFGTTTGTNAFGTEARVRPLDAWIVNDTVRVVVEAVEQGVGGMAVPAGKAVLSGHGTAAAFLAAKVKAGDTLRVYQRARPGPAGLKEMIGGNPIVVENGRQAPLDQSSFNRDRHPRTAVGFNADSTKVYLITVDGRQSRSAGMSNFELADLMLRLGIAHGLNLDGGGSTTMVVRGAIANSPSDGGGERTVGNALLAISTAPRGPLAHLHLTPTSSRVFTGKTIQFTISGSDAFYNPATLDPARAVYSVSPRLGTISATGLFTAGTVADTGYVRVAYEGRTDSAQVIVKTVARLDLSPRRAMTDTLRTLAFRVRTYDQDGLEQTVAPAALTWRVADPAVGTVDAAGVFRGRAVGTTAVIVTHGALADTAQVTVQVGAGTQVLDGMEDLGAWTLEGDNLDLTATRLSLAEDHVSQGTKSFRVDYRFTESASARNRILLTTDRLLFGVPDSLSIDVRSDGANHRVFFDLHDDTGAPFQAYVKAYARDATRFVAQPASVPEASPGVAGTKPVFPIRLKRINILLDYAGGRVAGQTYSGTLYLDNLRVVYPVQAVGVEDEAGPGGMGFRLMPSYPNPFSGVTTIRFATAQAQQVHLALYDVLGRERATVYEGTVAPGEHSVQLDAGALPNGLYFVRAAQGGGPAVKLVLVR